MRKQNSVCAADLHLNENELSIFKAECVEGKKKCGYNKYPTLFTFFQGGVEFLPSCVLTMVNDLNI